MYASDLREASRQLMVMIYSTFLSQIQTLTIEGVDNEESNACRKSKYHRKGDTLKQFKEQFFGGLKPVCYLGN